DVLVAQGVGTAVVGPDGLEGRELGLDRPAGARDRATLLVQADDGAGGRHAAGSWPPRRPVGERAREPIRAATGFLGDSPPYRGWITNRSRGSRSRPRCEPAGGAGLGRARVSGSGVPPAR